MSVGTWTNYFVKMSQDQLTIENRLNCRTDKLASEALVNEVATQHFISSNFPFENTRLLVKGGGQSPGHQRMQSLKAGEQGLHENCFIVGI